MTSMRARQALARRNGRSDDDAGADEGAKRGFEPLRLMLLTRALERKALELCTPVAVRRRAAGARGAEAIGVGSGLSMGPDDVLVASSRHLGAHLALGLAPSDYLRRSIGRTTSDSADRPGARLGFSRSDSDVADLAAGIALAKSLDGSAGAVVAIVAGKALSAGHFDDALALASSRHLPMVVVMEEGNAISPPGHEVVSASKVGAVGRAVEEGLERARAGQGGCVIVCRRPAAETKGLGGLVTLGGSTDVDPVNAELHRLSTRRGSREAIRGVRAEVVREVASASASILGTRNGQRAA